MSEYLVPRTGLELFCNANDSQNTNGLLLIDRSGNNRHLQASSKNSAPQIADFVNNRQCVIFNGSTSPLEAENINISAKHIFVIASADTSFTTFRGLLTDKTDVPVLVGDNGQARFLNAGYSLNAFYQYRKRDRVFAESNQIAPIGQPQIIEVRYDGGINLNSIQIGRDRTFAERNWQGKFVTLLLYNRVLTETERRDIYEYFAQTYWLWRETSDGQATVFPFIRNHGSEETLSKLAAVYNPPSGQRITRVRQTVKLKTSAQFSSSERSEFNAAQKFWDEHYPEKLINLEDRDGYISSELKFTELDGLFDYEFEFEEK